METRLEASRKDTNAALMGEDFDEFMALVALNFSVLNRSSVEMVIEFNSFICGCSSLILEKNREMNKIVLFYFI